MTDRVSVSDRQEHIRTIVMIICCALVVLTLLAGIIFAVVRDNDQKQVARLRCIDAGHSWIQNECVK